MGLSMKELPRFRSPYASELEEYIKYRSLTLSESTMEKERMYTVSFDRYLSARIEGKEPLHSGLMEDWSARRSWEKAITQKQRIDYTKRLFLFLNKNGISAELPPVALKNTQSDYIPYIYTKDELRRIFEASDHYTSTIKSPYLHLAVPVAFRILYGCGLRSSELTGLKVRDVELDRGFFCIWDTKFHKSRYVPFSDSLKRRLEVYIPARYPTATGEEYLISCTRGERYDTGAVHYWHMKLLYKAGIPHGGKGRGPRVHDYRHTFAVHSLQKIAEQGGDVMAFLPVLASYLGHKDLRGTQYYLHLTTELYPYILRAMGQKYGRLQEGGMNDEG